MDRDRNTMYHFDPGWRPWFDDGATCPRDLGYSAVGLFGWLPGRSGDGLEQHLGTAKNPGPQ